MTIRYYKFKLVDGDWFYAFFPVDNADGNSELVLSMWIDTTMDLLDSTECVEIEEGEYRLEMNDM